MKTFQMEYEEIIDMDPYAGYDPAADPYQAGDMAGEAEGLGSFEFYDEGIDPSGEDGLYFSETELPPEYEYDEYEELYDGPIVEDDILYTDDWLPLPPDAIPIETVPFEERPANYDTELYIGGLQYPDPASVRHSYCELYPEACAEGQGLNGREMYNGTEAAEEMSRTLKDVDLTGVCIAALLLLVLLFGLHYGGDSQPSQPSGEAAVIPRAESESKADEQKNYDGFLKVGGFPDDAKRKKQIDKIMAEPDKKKRAEMANTAVTPFYDSELKKAGYKDDKDRGDKVKAILAQKTPEDRTKKLEDYKKRLDPAANVDPPVPEPSSAEVREVSKKLKAAGIKDDADKSIAKRIAKMEQGKQDDEIKRLKEAQAQTSTGGDPAASGEPSAAAIDKTAEKLRAAGIKDDNKNTEATRIAKLPKEQQNDEIQKLKEKKVADANAAAAEKDEKERAGYEAKLKEYGYDDTQSKTLAGEVMKLAKDKRGEKMAEYKKNRPKPPGSTPESDPKAAQAVKDEKERAGYEARLKEYGYDEGKSKELAAEIMKLPKEKRTEKMAEHKKNKPEAPGTTADPGSGQPSKGGKKNGDTPPAPDLLTDDAITKQLAAVGYTEPELQKKRLGDIRAKGDAKAQQKELARIAAKDPGAIKDENTAARAKREAAAKAVGGGDDVAAGGDGKGSDGKGTSKTPATADELKAKLKELGYKDPVIGKMVKAWENEKDEKKKASMLRRMLKPENKASFEDKYKDRSDTVPPVGGPAEPPAGGEVPDGTADDKGKGNGKGKKPPSDEALLKYLKEKAKYSDEAIANMMKEYKAAKSDEDKLKLYEKFKDPKQKAANEKEYNPKAVLSTTPEAPPPIDGAAPPKGNDIGTPDPNAGKPSKPKYTTAQDFDKALKGSKYSSPARKAMLKAWEDEKDPTKRAELEKKLITKDPAQHAANELEYAKKPYESPVVDSSKPKLAGMTEDELRKLLKTTGYDDKDAQDEIMDKLRAVKDEKGQKELLKKDYLRSPDTVKKKNEQLGKERRARAAGEDPNKAGGDPAGAEIDVPTDEELDKRLKEAGWTDEKARKQAIDKIRDKATPDDRLKEMKKHLRSGAANPDSMASYAKAWEKKQKAGDDGKGKSIAAMTPEDEAKIDKDLEAAGITDPLARKNMIEELKNKTEPKDRDKKLQRWLSTDPTKVGDLNKRRGDAQRKIEKGDGTNSDGSPRGGKGGGDDSPTKKPAYPYWILGFLLIPLLFALARGGPVTMPTGRYPLTMPSLPPLGGPWATGGSWGPWGAREVGVTTGPKINRGLPELPRRKTTKSVSSPRLVPRSGSSAPSININNVNAQGENIPIDINSGGPGGAVYDSVVEEVVVTEEIPAVVTETVVTETVGEETIFIPDGVAEEKVVIIQEEPIETFAFQGPSDPDRLMWILISAGIISIPLLLDMTAGWPLRRSANIEYLSDAIHWLVLLSAAAAVYLKLDQTYHWSSRYGRHVPRYVTPVVVGAARGTENLLWSVDDAMFGGDQQMLGIAVVGAAFALMTMWNPFSSTEAGKPTDGGGQMAGIAAMGMVAFLMANA